MSPLGLLVLRVMKWGVGFCALSLGLFLVALVWNRWIAPLGLHSGLGPLVFIALCFLGAVWLFRAIGREAKSQAPK
jgi:hypothetical protein